MKIVYFFLFFAFWIIHVNAYTWFTTDNIYNNYIEILPNESYIEDVGTWQDLLIENVYLSWSQNIKIYDNLLIKSNFSQVFYFQNKFDFLIKDKLILNNSWSESSFLYLNWKILNENTPIFWVYDSQELSFSGNINFENSKYTGEEINNILKDMLKNNSMGGVISLILNWVILIVLLYLTCLSGFKSWFYIMKTKILWIK